MAITQPTQIKNIESFKGSLHFLKHPPSPNKQTPKKALYTLQLLLQLKNASILLFKYKEK